MLVRAGIPTAATAAPRVTILAEYCQQGPRRSIRSRATPHVALMRWLLVLFSLPLARHDCSVVDIAWYAIIVASSLFSRRAITISFRQVTHDFLRWWIGTWGWLVSGRYLQRRLIVTTYYRHTPRRRIYCFIRVLHCTLAFHFHIKAGRDALSFETTITNASSVDFH